MNPKLPFMKIYSNEHKSFLNKHNQSFKEKYGYSSDDVLIFDLYLTKDESIMVVSFLGKPEEDGYVVMTEFAPDNIWGSIAYDKDITSRIVPSKNLAQIIKFRNEKGHEKYNQLFSKSIPQLSGNNQINLEYYSALLIYRLLFTPQNINGNQPEQFLNLINKLENINGFQDLLKEQADLMDFIESLNK